MKEETKSPEKELNKMEINNLSDAEFKTLVKRMLNELSEDPNSIKKIQDTLIEMKNNIKGNNSGGDVTENQINDLEHKEAKNNQSETQEEKRIKRKNEDSVSSLWANFKYSNICIIGVPEGDRKSKKLRIYLKK